MDIANFRDLGGIQTVDGRTVAPKRLLRCGDLFQISDETVQELRDVYHVKNIVDLRTKTEREMQPDREIPGAEYRILDFFPDTEAMGPTGSADQLGQMQNIEMVHQYMEALYSDFICKETAREGLRELLEVLKDTKEGATIFHCFAGKDRTGIAAAVILTILGVSRELIMKDYLETNRMRTEANQKILEDLRGKNVPEAMLISIEAALCVDSRYLNASFETAEREYGSFEGYIEEGIGFGKADQELLKELYLESVI